MRTKQRILPNLTIRHPHPFIQSEFGLKGLSDPEHDLLWRAGVLFWLWASAEAEHLIGRTPPNQSRNHRNQPKQEPIICGAPESQTRNQQANNNTNYPFGWMYILFHFASPESVLNIIVLGGRINNPTLVLI